MSLMRWRRVLLWTAQLGALGAAVGLYRFYRTTPELRLPETEARWQLVLPVLLMIVIGTLLLSDRAPGAGDPPSTH